MFLVLIPPQVLKSCDAHSNEYVNRLKDEPKVVAILEKGQKLLEAKAAPASDMCRIYLKRIEHIYFKFDPKVVQQKNVSTVEPRCSLVDPSGFTMISYTGWTWWSWTLVG